MFQDPYKIQNSQQLISFLQENGKDVASGFSIDVKDTYYSIPHASIMPILRDSIEKQGVSPFQNAAGVNVDSFLELLGCYLTATVVSHEGQAYVQRSGVCIGSRVAPHLCDVYLAA